MKRTFLLLKTMSCLVLMAALIAGCTKPKDISGEIREINKAFMAAFDSGNAQTISGFYATDGKLYPANVPVIDGTDGIEQYWKGALMMGVKRVVLETTKAMQYGKFALEEGSYTLYAPGDLIIDQGKYIVTWRKDNGKWLIERDMWNSNIPAPHFMARENDTVMILSYRIKADKVKQFEDFNFNTMLPAAAEMKPLVRATVRMLRPVEANADGSYTYQYMMEGVKNRADYDIGVLLVAKYGEEKAREYYRIFLDCLKDQKYDQVLTIQTAL